MEWYGHRIAGSKLALSKLRAIVRYTIYVYNILETSPVTDIWIAMRYGKFVSCVYRHPTALTRSSIEVHTWCFQATKTKYEEVMSCKSPVHGGPRGYCIQYGCTNTANKFGTTFNMTAWTPQTNLALHSIWLHEHREQIWHYIQYDCKNTANKFGTTFSMTAWTPRTNLALHSIWLHEHREQIWHYIQYDCVNTVNEILTTWRLCTLHGLIEHSQMWMPKDLKQRLLRRWTLCTQGGLRQHYTLCCI
jgi:L-rhamnose mutarotase